MLPDHICSIKACGQADCKRTQAFSPLIHSLTKQNLQRLIPGQSTKSSQQLQRELTILLAWRAIAWLALGSTIGLTRVSVRRSCRGAILRLVHCLWLCRRASILRGWSTCRVILILRKTMESCMSTLPWCRLLYEELQLSSIKANAMSECLKIVTMSVCSFKLNVEKLQWHAKCQPSRGLRLAKAIVILPI